MVPPNNVYTLGPSPTLVCVFRDINPIVSMKTEAIPMRREGGKGLPGLRPRITDQSGGKDLSCGSGWGLPQVRSLGKRFGGCGTTIYQYNTSTYKACFFLFHALLILPKGARFGSSPWPPNIADRDGADANLRPQGLSMVIIPQTESCFRGNGSSGNKRHRYRRAGPRKQRLVIQSVS
jgi:hypothetical protein